MFRSSLPATADAFFGRDAELVRLEGALGQLEAGHPRWVAVVGPRKIGKTSLLLELARRNAREPLAFVVLDSFEELPLSLLVFRRLALRATDAIFGREAGTSLEALAVRPTEFRAALQRSSAYAALPAELRTELLELPSIEPDSAGVRALVDLPERIARATGRLMVVAWDEFQELAALATGRGALEIFPLLRSIWQRHEKVTYFISGSARTMLLELVTAERSPFFQHFDLIELGPLDATVARQLLTHGAQPKSLAVELAQRAVEIVGGHPFYLQLLGEAIVAGEGGDGESRLKHAVQTLLFSRSGRLALYFENEFAQRVGRSSYLAAVLQALARGPRRLSDIASAIGAPSGATVKYIERLGDTVIRDAEGVYRLADPVFGLWLSWRQPGGTVVPMQLVGDEAEKAVATHLARLGFDLVYQSRASRGAFDLLAIRGPQQLGVQVKRSALPLRFTLPAWKRMVAEGERLGWRWIVAAVAPPPGEAITLLDPARARRGKEATLAARAAIDNLLLWVDRRG